jgi:hypothetical protein
MPPKRSRGGRSGKPSAPRRKTAPPSSRPKARAAPRAKRGGRSLGSELVKGGLGVASSLVGGFARSLLSGSGAYRMRHNTVAAGAAPAMFSSTADGMRVVHREFIGDVFGSTAFTSTQFGINPGDVGTFPWLSGLASNFEEYKFHGLVFEYRPTSGASVASANTALGTVLLATQYNVLDAPFPGKQEMDAYEYSTSTVPFTGTLHGVECAPTLNPVATLYIRHGIGAVTGDPRMYDLGTTTVAAVGMQGAYDVGELWVSYDVMFRKPRISPDASDGISASYAHFYNGSAAKTTPFTGAKATAETNLPDVTIYSANQLLFSNPGNYLVFTAWEDLSDTLTAAPAAPTLGASIAFLDLSQYINAGPSYSAYSTNYAFQTFAITVESTGSSTANLVTIGGPTGAVTSDFDLWVTLVPYEASV